MLDINEQQENHGAASQQCSKLILAFTAARSSSTVDWSSFLLNRTFSFSSFRRSSIETRSSASRIRCSFYQGLRFPQSSIRSIQSFFDRWMNCSLQGSIVLELIVLLRVGRMDYLFSVTGQCCPYSVLALFLSAFLAYSRYLLPRLFRCPLYLREISVFCDFSRSVVAMVLLMAGELAFLFSLRRAVQLLTRSIFCLIACLCCYMVYLLRSSSARIFMIFLECGGGWQEVLDTDDFSRLSWLFFHSRYYFQ